MQSARHFLRPFVRRAAAAMYGNRPIASWPPILGRIHEITIPRAVIPNPTPQPTGSANINNLIAFIEKTRQVPGEIAECGVFRGQSLIPMAIYLRQQGIDKKVYGFDSFEGFAPSVVDDLKLGGTNAEWKQPGVMNDTSQERVAAKVDVFGLHNVILVKGYFEATFPAYSKMNFSYVHLDCDAYAAYKECLEFFYPRLRRGGIVSFDEYNDPPWPGCKAAVDEFLAGKPEKLEVIALDNYEKWYFVKQ